MLQLRRLSTFSGHRLEGVFSVFLGTLCFVGQLSWVSRVDGSTRGFVGGMVRPPSTEVRMSFPQRSRSRSGTMTALSHLAAGAGSEGF